MRVLIVDDSAFMRRALSDIFAAERDIEVVATARNGREGVELAVEHTPDLITMDIEMPEMDGLTALRRIMRLAPTKVIMLSSLTTDGSKAALTALRLGAADVLAKQVDHGHKHIDGMREEIVTRVRAIGAKAKMPPPKPQPAKRSADAAALDKLGRGHFDLVLIGCSTGGPPVLENILMACAARPRTPIVVAQHMPQMFTKSMAERLDHVCPPRVVHIDDGMPLMPGTVHICPGGLNTHLVGRSARTITLRTNREPEGTIYFPSVSALFSSAAAVNPTRTLGIVLTGMGDDGLNGAKQLVEAGGKVVAQDAASCVVYGMPRAVTEAGLTDVSATPAQLATLVATLTGGAAATAAA
jgi:two-component system chemotaxis response regulator CheB